ncbi:MAG: hypothetical protein O3C65_14190 [Proteobacteria bacterium]|nr:hypothetical protein [Pseudomonadota bacterium]MDA1059824.1 hypothetical protein [Pseudomonadota bacterium]
MPEQPTPHPRRIAIVGNAGSGKSRLAAQIAKATSLPLFHLDQFFWSAGWFMVGEQAFTARHADLIARPMWVIDGNFARTLTERANAADLVIVLDLPLWQCLWGVIRRVVTSYGTVRPDMTPGCPERVDFAFLRYVWTWRTTRRARTMAHLDTAIAAGKVIVVPRRRDIRKVWLALGVAPSTRG